MTLPRDAMLLRIFIGEDDKTRERRPLYEAIVLKARETRLAGDGYARPDGLRPFEPSSYKRFCGSPRTCRSSSKSSTLGAKILIFAHPRQQGFTAFSPRGILDTKEHRAKS